MIVDDSFSSFSVHMIVHDSWGNVSLQTNINYVMPLDWGLMLELYTAVNHNYNDNQWTLKKYRNK